MAELLTIQSLVALITLTVLELVLGVDNIIFLAIVTENVPDEKKDFVRKLGLSLALVGRIVMVLGISWLLQLDNTLFTIAGHGFSAEDLILIAGGIFLTYKAVTEIYKETELKEEEHTAERSAAAAGKSAMAGVIAQIVVVDMVFAIDSVLTAVGLTDQYVLIIISDDHRDTRDDVLRQTSVRLHSRAPFTQDARALVPRTHRRATAR